MREFKCDDCQWVGYPGFELQGVKLYAQCGNGECGRIDRRYTPADFNTGIARIDGEDIVVSAAEAPQSVSRPTPMAALRAMPASIRHAAAQRPGPVDVITLAQERADYLRVEAARLEGELAGAKTELKKLDRMLRAAHRIEGEERRAPTTNGITQ